MHLYRGRLIADGFPILQPDPAFVMPHKVGFYWLFQWMLYRVYDLGGISGVNVFFSLVWSASLWLAWRLTRPGFWTMIWMIAGILVIHVRFQERPEPLSFLFFMIFTFTLVKSKGWWAERRKVIPLALTLGITQVIWSNIHGFFVLGPALVLLAMAVDIFETSLWKPEHRGKQLVQIKAWGGLFLLVLLLGMASPVGWQNYRWAFDHFTQLQDLRDVIAEFRPLHAVGRLGTINKYKYFSFAYLGIMTLFTLWILIKRPRRAILEILLALLGLGLSLLTVRFLPFSLFMLSPIFGLWSKQRETRPWEKKAMLLPGIICTALIVSVVTNEFYRFNSSSARFGAGINPQLAPKAMAQKLCQPPLNGLIFNESTDGGYLAFHCPELHLYGHSLHTNSAWSRRYLQTSNARDLETISEAPDAALLEIRQHQNLIGELLREGNWELKGIEPCRALFVRKGSRLASLERFPLNFFELGRSFRDIPFGHCSVNWVNAIAAASRVDLLLEMLNQSSASVDVPGPLLSLTYEYALLAGDRNAAGRALELSSKAVFPDDTQLQNFQALQATALQQLDLK